VGCAVACGDLEVSCETIGENLFSNILGEAIRGVNIAGRITVNPADAKPKASGAGASTEGRESATKRIVTLAPDP